LKIFYNDIIGRTITIELPIVEMPNPTNIRQTLFSHEDKPENVIVIREEQDARELHQEKQEKREKVEKIKDTPKNKRTQEEKKEKKKKQPKKKKIKKEIKRIETSSDEYENLSETETEKENAEPSFNL
jgi:outer membrane biosynthesis protein TonB